MGGTPNIVILASVHGVLPQDNKQVSTFTVPEGFSITRIMATRPGVCNVTNEDQINSLVAAMSKNPEETAKILKITQKEVIKSISNIKSDDENKSLFQEYKRYNIVNPTVKTFIQGDEMLNKFFARSPDEDMDKPFDYKLNIVNSIGKYDLMDYLKTGTVGVAAHTRSKVGEMGAYLSEIIEVLRNEGFNNLVLFDLACSSFMNDEYLSRYEKRSMRADIEQRGIGRKKTRRPKRKTKTRRGKKRTIQWKH